MPREISPGVYVLDTPRTREYAASKASRFTEKLRKDEIERWDLAMKAAIANIKNENEAYNARRKILEDAIDSLDKDIDSSKKRLEDFRQQGIKAQETLDGKNADRRSQREIAQARMDASAAQQNENRRLGVDRFGNKISGAVEKDERANIEAVKKDMADRGLFLVPTEPGAILTPAQKFHNAYVLGGQTSNTSGKTNPDTSLTIMIDMEIARAKATGNPKDLEDVLDAAAPYMDAHARGKEQLAGIGSTGSSGGTSVGGSTGSKNISAPRLKDTEEVPLQDKAREDLTKQYEDELSALESKRLALREQLASAKAPKVDLIQDARDEYAKAFGGNKNYYDNKAVRALESFLDSYIEKEIRNIDGDVTPEKIAHARLVGIEKAKQALQGKAWSEPKEKPKEKPISTNKEAPATKESKASFVSYTVPEHGDYSITYKEKPDVYAGNPNGRPEFIVVDNVTNQAETFTEDTIGFKELKKQYDETANRAIQLDLKQGKQPIASSGEADWVDDERISKWMWDPRTKTYSTTAIGKPTELQYYGPNSKEAKRLSERSKIQRNLYYQDKAREDNIRIAKEKADKEATSTPSKESFKPKPIEDIPSVPREEGPILRTDKQQGMEKGYSKDNPDNPKKSSEQEHKDNILSTFMGALKLENQPKRIDRIVKNSSYGQLVMDIIDSNPSGDKGLSPKEIQKKVIDEFPDDYETRMKALELANALIIREDKKKLVIKR